MIEKRADNLQASADLLPAIYQADNSEVSIQAVPIEQGRQLHSTGKAEPTSEFPSPGSKKMDGSLPVALQYPGKRPESSYSLTDDQVALGRLLESIPVTTSVSLEKGLAFYVNVRGQDGRELVWNIDDLLENAGATKLEERIPVITFGSNANPGQLALKMEDLEGRPDKYIVPTLKARVKGMAPVYVARIGINGYTFTDLVPTQDPEAKTEVYINFLTRPQLEAVNATEGAYSLCELPDVLVDTADGEGIKTPAYLYVGRADAKAADILTDEHGRPIRLAELQTEGQGISEQFASMTQSEVQHYIAEIAREKVAAKLGIPVEQIGADFDLVKLVINRNKDERLANFKAQLSPEDLKRFGGVLTQDVIQRSIKETGRVVSGRNIRDQIAPENLDKTLGDVKTFAELLEKSIAGRTR